MLSRELKSDIQRLWDKFWSGGIANPLTAIEQIAYLIFMKRLEEADNKSVKENPEYKSIFDGPNDLRRWSNFKHESGENLLKLVRDQVFPLIVKLGGDRMRDAVFIIPSPTMLQSAIEIIDKLFVPSRNADTLGDIYEYLLSEIQTSGKNGQFRTPRHIIRAIIQLVNPQFQGSQPPRICDPACGTAGFLVNSYIHIMAQHTSNDILKTEADGNLDDWAGDKLGKTQSEALRANTFYGFDFDRTMVRIGWMNMVQHGFTNPHIEYADTLSKNGRGRAENDGPYDYVLANPPFTGSIEAADKSDLFKVKTNKTELLFLELILDLLKVGGRAGVILPEGVLFGSTNAHRELRKRLVTENQLEAVVSLPAGVFNPYAGVKTSAVIFTKGGHTDTIWFYEVRADGQTLGAKRETRVDQNDLWDLVEKFRTRDTSLSYHQPVFREELQANGEDESLKFFDHFDVVTLDKPHAWTVTAQEVEEKDWSLSAGRHKPFSLVATEHEPPSKLIRELQAMEAEIQQGLDNLLAMVETIQ